MKKYNSFLYLGVIILASSVGTQTFAISGARTTNEARAAALSSVDTKTALSGTQGALTPVAMNDLVASAAGSASITAALFASVKTNPQQMTALLDKLENDIAYRDAMLASLLEDLELISMILNDSKLTAHYPKTAATLHAAVSAPAAH